MVNDGSRDGTLQALIDAFELVAVERVPRANLPTWPVRQVYVSATEPDLLVIDKENGGKADSINAGLCFARYPLFCTVDSDTLIDDDALVRLVRPFQVHPETVACGGVVRIVNGSTLEGSHVAEVADPAQPAGQHPDRRVPARVPGGPRRLVADQRAADHLRRLRPVPPPDGDRRRRLRRDDRGRGRRARRPPAPPLPRAGRGLPRRVRRRPRLLDRGAVLAARAGAPAQPLAPRPDRDPVAAPAHDRAPPLRRDRPVRDAVLRRLRGARAR